jgi:hypothetical protein
MKMDILKMSKIENLNYFLEKNTQKSLCDDNALIFIFYPYFL